MSRKYNKVVEAIDKLYSDTSKPKEETIRDLESLKDEINMKLETLKI